MQRNNGKSKRTFAMFFYFIFAASQTPFRLFLSCLLVLATFSRRASLRVLVTSFVKFPRATMAHRILQNALNSNHHHGFVLSPYLFDSQIWCFASSPFSFVTMLSYSQALNLRLHNHHRRSKLFRWPPRFTKHVHTRNFTNSSTTCFYADLYYGVNVSFALLIISWSCNLFAIWSIRVSFLEN